MIANDRMFVSETVNAQRQRTSQLPALVASLRASTICRMFNPLHPEIRSWLLNPSHPVALVAVMIALLAAIASQALAQ